MQSIKHVLLVGSLLLSTAATADQPFYGVPVFENGKSLARYDESLPAVMTYYLKATPSDILSRYQNELGEPNKIEKVGKRTTLHYETEQQIILTISAQDHWTQIDILVRE